MERTFTASSADPGQLVVDALTEVIVLLEGGFVPADVVVEVGVKDSTLHAAGVVSGEPYNREKHGIGTEVKAATHHELAVGDSDGVWEIVVILDL